MYKRGEEKPVGRVFFILQNGQQSPDDSAVATIVVKGADARFQPLTANRVFRSELIIFRSLRCLYLGNISIKLQL